MKRLGIRKETKNKWERRVPLTPRAVRMLTDQGVEVLVQPSQIRVYNDLDFEKAGAIITEDLSSCDLIAGVKEIPIDDIVPDTAHIYFSHTIKGQSFNMPMLQRILDTGVTLFDYEKIVDEYNRRLVFFGKFAGNAGIVETLKGYGDRLKALHHIDTPFLKIRHAYEYDSLRDAMDHLREIGSEIAEHGLPRSIAPLVIFQLGYGHVASGCEEVLNVLPIERIDPPYLHVLKEDWSPHRIYLSVFKEEHLVARKDDGTFNLKDYFENGTQYRSRTSEYLDYASIWMNAIYWAPGYPVFLTREQCKEAVEKERLLIVGDISCDIDGSVAATIRCTKPDTPVYIYDPESGGSIDGVHGEGLAVCAVDNLPCEFSLEASENFSMILEPFIEKMLSAMDNKKIDFDALPPEIQRCCIVLNGKLRPDYAYLSQYLQN